MRRGYSMVEVLTVVILIGVLSALAVTRWHTITAQSRLDGDANAFFEDINRVRQDAVRTGWRHYVRVVGGADSARWEVWRETEAGQPFALDNRDVRLRSTLFSRSVGPGATSAHDFDVATLGTSAMRGLTAPLSVLGTGFVKNGTLAGGALDLAGQTCADEVNPSTPGGGAGGWKDGIIAFCAGTLGTMESGAMVFTSTDSRSRAYLAVIDAARDLRLRQFRWMGDAWEEL